MQFKVLAQQRSKVILLYKDSTGCSCAIAYKSNKGKNICKKLVSYVPLEMLSINLLG